MEPVFVYSSTVVVLWAVGLVPFCIQRKRVDLFVVSALAVLAGQIFFSSDVHPYPRNVIVAVAIVAFAAVGGYVQHLVNARDGGGAAEK